MPERIFADNNLLAGRAREAKKQEAGERANEPLNQLLKY